MRVFNRPEISSFWLGTQPEIRSLKQALNSNSKSTTSIIFFPLSSLEHMAHEGSSSDLEHCWLCITNIIVITLFKSTIAWKYPGKRSSEHYIQFSLSQLKHLSADLFQSFPVWTWNKGMDISQTSHSGHTNLPSASKINTKVLKYSVFQFWFEPELCFS